MCASYISSDFALLDTFSHPPWRPAISTAWRGIQSLPRAVTGSASQGERPEVSPGVILQFQRPGYAAISIYADVLRIHVAPVAPPCAVEGSGALLAEVADAAPLCRRAGALLLPLPGCGQDVQLRHSRQLSPHQLARVCTGQDGECQVAGGRTVFRLPR